MQYLAIHTGCSLRPHSIILASCKPGVRHAFDTFSTFFVENLVANLLHQSRHVEIDAAGSLVHTRATQMECRKPCFEPANEPAKAGFSLRILLYVLIMT